MSKQTINIGASPNDGTGTPLRTSFDYTNQNFTELYTALGGGVGLPGATTQVIFNDGGTNLAGDAGLVYNKTTDTLTAGNATITGDLTVDTSTLKVDSTNNRVIVGHTSGSAAFQVTNAGAAGLEIQPTGFSSAPLIQSYNRSGSAYTQLTLDASTIVHALSGTTAMTLNSTGLGIGVSPGTARLTVARANTTVATRGTIYTYSTDSFAIDLGGQISFGGSYTGTTETIFGSVAGRKETATDNDIAGYLQFSTTGVASGNVERMRINSSGNVGIGVTPSAWLSSLSALQVKGVSGLYGAGSSELGSVQNCFYNASSQWIYGTTAAAGKYAISSGVHQWYNAPSGTAGTAITFTQAMTLDASGNLLVGTTAVGMTAGGVRLKNGGGNLGEISLSNNSGAADYVARFVWGSGATLVGNITVSSVATVYNTTSDYRLKESVKPLSGGLARVNALKPSVYNWKSDGSNGEGFLAHELAEVVPAAVTGEKDAVNADGSIKSQGIDMSRVVPILVAAIQELTAEVNALKNA